MSCLRLRTGMASHPKPGKSFQVPVGFAKIRWGSKRTRQARRRPGKVGTSQSRFARIAGHQHSHPASLGTGAADIKAVPPVCFCEWPRFIRSGSGGGVAPNLRAPASLIARLWYSKSLLTLGDHPFGLFLRVRTGFLEICK